MPKNQPIRKGDAVFSECGHDAGCFYAALCDEKDGYVLIADGKHRKVCHPKRKKCKHLRLAGSIDGYSEREAEFGISDPYLVRVLRPYNDKLKDWRKDRVQG